MERLTNEQVQTTLATLPKWKIKDAKWIERKYIFHTFLDSIAFTNEIATLSETNHHHPFISIQYKVVSLSYTSWHARGLTQLDFDLAQKCDTIYTTYHT
ncbi:MAG: 4a-hydroxytetrahydrobiopterin dehydratase [Bacillaceae bacterium]